MKLSTLWQRLPKRALAGLAVATAVVLPVAVQAWGPSNRPTYTMAQPAGHVTFNSITDNPKYGDERNFVQVRNVTDNTKFGEETTLAPGKEYEVFVMYHNNASSGLNDAAHSYKGIALGTTMRAEMPASIASGNSARITGYVSATNAQPGQVWDEAYAKNTTGSEIALRYVAGSAKITSNGAVNGNTLPDSLFTTGTSLGYDTLDGKVPGCGQYMGYVTYRFKADQPNFELQKQVSVAGANQYGEQVSAKFGDTVDFKLKYKNTGTTQQDGVAIVDKMPAGLTYIAGSSVYSNSSTNNQWKAVGNDTVSQGGLNIGSYAAGGAGYVKFSAKVTDASALKCGINTVTNTATVNTQNGAKSDTASVTVTKECKEVPKETPLSVCDIKAKKIVTINKSQFDTKLYSTNAADCAAPAVPQTPVVPVVELPKTGMGELFATVLGLGALTTAAGYYIASRKL